MKISNRQLIKIFNGMPTVMRKQVPVKIGFAINRNIKAMESAAEAYTAEQRKILDKYCEKDEFGQFKTEGEEYVLADRKAYGEEMNELLGIENEIQIHTVSLDDIEKCDSEKFDALTPDELSLMEFMIEE